MKKYLRRGAALVLSIALLFSLVAVVAESNWGETDSIGLLSRYYETGSTNSDPGIISTVPGDPGGKSYGVFMFASNPGTVMDFIDWCLSRDTGSAAFGIGTRLKAAHQIDGYGSIFDEAWKAEAKYASEFLSAQEGFVGAEIYDATLDNLREYRGITLPADYYSTALKNVIWSRAVHHGPEGAGYVIKRALGSTGFIYQSEGDLIEAIYKESGRVVTYAELAAELEANGSTVPKESSVATMSGPLAEKYGVSGKILRYWYGSSGAVQLSVYRRLNVYEVGDALTLLKNNAMPENKPAPGNYNISLQATQQLYLQSALVDSVASPALNTENAGKFTLEYLFGADAYTISTVVGEQTLRLSADENGVVTLTTPDDTDRQLWLIEQDGSNGYTVRNKLAVNRNANPTLETAHPAYLSYQDNTLKLVAPADAIPADGDTPAVPAVVPSTWRFSSATTENADWTLRWVIAPKENVNIIKEDDSAFPVRGLISCSSPISSVSLTILDKNGTKVSYASKTVSLSGGTYAYDLKDMDQYISYSQLPEDSYQYVLSATTGDSTFDKLVESSFTVGAAGTSAPPVIILPPAVDDDELPPVEIPPAEDSESVTIAFLVGDYGSCATTSKTYSLDDITFGKLPTVQADAGWRFVGWFAAPNGEGGEILPGSQIPAANMAVYAHYTKINSYKFLNAAGKTFNYAGSTGSAAPGELVEKPSETPIKNPDSKYTYDFSHWEDNNGKKYGAKDSIVMGESDMTFTPVYTATKISDDTSTKPPVDNSGGSSSGGDSTTKPSGSTWTISPGTSVSQMSGTVYSNGKVVTSGNLATGMTTTVDGKEYTISVKGDPSGDGKVSVTDVVKLQSHLLNKTTLSGAYLKAADFNGDGNVTITDLVKAACVVAGKEKIS